MGMGLLRFFLASLVLASHLGHSLWGHNPGVVAVVVFYMLAGHVVARLWVKQRAVGVSGGDALGHFYCDRLLRILPQYLLVLCVASLLWATAGVQSPFLARSPGAGDWAANLVVVPLSYFMYTDIQSFTLVPVAWSLGVELQFYALAPLLLSLTLRRQALWMLASLVIYILAQVQILQPDHFGYRLLPGVLFVFMLGGWLAQRHALRWVIMLWCLGFFYLLSLWFAGNATPYLREVILGLVLGVPLVFRWPFIHRTTQTAAASRWLKFDQWLGHLSYGIFLWHFPVLWAIGLQPPDLAPARLFQVWAVSAGTAALAHVLLERPLWTRWRKHHGLVA
jgi:peptidoglycan/LPS O-acetylase OafA/YrhL